MLSSQLKVPLLTACELERLSKNKGKDKYYDRGDSEYMMMLHAEYAGWTMLISRIHILAQTTVAGGPTPRVQVSSTSGEIVEGALHADCYHKWRRYVTEC